jgi:hypothetical protein
MAMPRLRLPPLLLLLLGAAAGSAASLTLDGAAGAALAETGVLVEAHCGNALRIRVAAPGAAVQKELIGALDEQCGGSRSEQTQEVLGGPGTLSNGNIKAVVTSSTLTVTRVSDGATLLSGPLPTFGAANCGGSGYHTINASFATGQPTSGNKWYGLGQLGASDASGSQRNCADGGSSSAPCVVSLERGALGPVPITSVK